MASFYLKPQDIGLLLWLGIHKGGIWSIANVAEALGLSVGEAHASIKRSRLAGLLRSVKPEQKPLAATTPGRQPDLYDVFAAGFHEFLVHGLRYAFATAPGPVRRGIPTAHSVEPLAAQIVASVGDALVWPHPQGTLRGASIAPLYPSFPAAALRDPLFHEVLALADALRVGRARERTLAADFLADRLGLKVAAAA